MNQPVKFYYRSSLVVFRSAIVSAMAALLIWSPFPSTYLRFLEYYPGRAVIWMLVASMVAILISQLPTLVRSIGRIPAVEYDGRTLLVRGWEDRSFDTLTDDIRVEAVIHQVRVSVSGRPAASIHLRDIEGPTTLLRFLDDIAAGTKNHRDGIR